MSLSVVKNFFFFCKYLRFNDMIELSYVPSISKWLIKIKIRSSEILLVLGDRIYNKLSTLFLDILLKYPYL